MSKLNFLFSPLALAVCVASFALPAVALESIDDAGLSLVDGQDGLSADIVTPAAGISAQQMRLMLDQSTTNAATMRMEGVSLRGVDTVGNVGGASTLSMALDAGERASLPYLNFQLQLSRSRLRIDDLRHEGDVTRSYGTLALDASASMRLANPNGLLNSSATNTYLRGELTNAKLFYRQLWHQHPYLIMNNLNALWEIPAGSVGVTAQGIRMTTDGGSSSLINVLLDFDILYKFPYLNAEATEFLITGNERPLMHFGWLGSLRNAELIWRPGGVWSGTTPSGVAGVGDVFNVANKTEGLWFSSRWNFVSHAETVSGGGTLADSTEFRWQLGEAASTGADQSRINFELSDWATWGSNTYGHNFPLIALDVINETQGPGGLCWGFAYDGPTTGACGTGSAYDRLFVNLTPGTVDDDFNSATAARTDGKAIAIIVRDGQLQSYSRRIKLLERNSAGVVTTRSFNWGLIYTLANLDANIYLYPGGNPSDTAGGSMNRGIIADIMLMSQTFGATDNAATTTVNETYTQGFNWDKGSHFMIADTDLDKDGITGEARDAMGIGLVSTSFLLLADDTRLWVKPQWTPTDYYEGGIDLLSRQARINVKGTFGGGVLPPYGGAGQEIVRGAFINLNLEGLVNFRLSPASPTATDGKNYLGYSAAFRLMNTNVANFSESTLGTTADDGSFLSISEPSNNSVDFRLADVQGDLAITGGRIDLRGTTEDGDNKPKLVLAQTLQFGSTAAARMTDAVTGTTLPAIPSGSAAGQPFDIKRVEFGNQALGRIVIPSGQLYTSIALKPQN